VVTTGCCWVGGGGDEGSNLGFASPKKGWLRGAGCRFSPKAISPQGSPGWEGGRGKARKGGGRGRGGEGEGEGRKRERRGGGEGDGGEGQRRSMPVLDKSAASACDWGFSNTG
jgi:hypothetical protein